VDAARPSTTDTQKAGWRAPEPAAPKAHPVRAAQSRAVRRLTRMIRRLIGMVVLLAMLAVLALVGSSAVFNSSPDKVLNRVVVVFDQIRGAGS
jgi:hypothetical protein